jgi:alkylation response protein AidB-like acyl-CoA dehydrogenase
VAAQARLGRGDGAVAVTEPDYGSDVAGVKVTATPTDGGWLINGVKTWCTFGARADVLMLLARTDPDRSKTHRGLSLFCVPKERGDAHGFELVQEAGADGGARAAGRWRAARSTRSATGACTPTRSPSTTGSCPTTT